MVSDGVFYTVMLLCACFIAANIGWMIGGHRARKRWQAREWNFNSEAKWRKDAQNDICPDCSGSLDTGWQCTDCGYDAKWLIDTAPFQDRIQPESDQ